MALIRELDRSQLGQKLDNTQMLDVVGRKINVKAERKVSRLHRMQLAAIIIQKCWRGLKACRRVYELKLHILVTFLQKNVRMFLAKRKLKFLKIKNKAAKCI